MYYHSQQENENIWGFHQNDVIINKITQLFSDEKNFYFIISINSDDLFPKLFEIELSVIIS